MKDKRILVALSKEELKRLKRLSKKYKVSMSAIVRMAIGNYND